MKLERRVVTVGNLEVRELGDGRREYRGDAIRFDEPSENLGGFVEYVDSDCEIAGDDVRHLINHDANLILGRTTSGTTRLERTGGAVGVATDMPDTSYARDLAVSIERRDVTQMSFGFRVVPASDGSRGDRWDTSTSPPSRHLRSIELHDVSTVTFPAYPTTTAEVRSHVRALGPAVVAWDGEAGMCDWLDDISASLPIGYDGDDYAWGYCADATVDGQSALIVWYDNGGCELYVAPVTVDDQGEPSAADQGSWTSVEWQLVVSTDEDVRNLRAGLERRAGKAISSENADHVSAISDALDSMSEHISALADAAGLSESDAEAEVDGDGDAEYNARPRELDELAIHIASATT